MLLLPHYATRARRVWLVALMALWAFPLAIACGQSGSQGGPGPVITTIAPLGALVAAVAGDHLAVRVLARAGADPHEYEVTADDRKAISDARAIFRIGNGIDDFLDKANPPQSRVTTVTEGLALRAGPEGKGHDPHVWHDIDLDKAMLDRIAQRLAEIDPLNADAYRANAAAYKATLDETDAEIRGLLDQIPAANRKVVTNHDAFGYFLDRYGLTFTAAIIPGQTTQSEPSAKEIAALIDLIRGEAVKAIFAESSVDPKVAHELAKDTGVKIVDDLYSDSLGGPGSGAETLHGMLLANAEKFAEALR